MNRHCGPDRSFDPRTRPPRPRYRPLGLKALLFFRKCCKLKSEINRRVIIVTSEERRIINGYSETAIPICVVMDLFSRKVLSHCVGRSETTYLIKRTIRLAYEERQLGKDLIFHSDYALPCLSCFRIRIAQIIHILATTAKHNKEIVSNLICDFKSLNATSLLRIIAFCLIIIKVSNDISIRNTSFRKAIPQKLVFFLQSRDSVLQLS